MHKTKSSKTDSSTYSNSSALNSSPQLAHRPYGSEIQKASVAAKTPTDIENEAFAEQQMEATGLSIQAKSGSITSEGQERLTVLQAKMNGLLNSRLEHATRFGHNIANTPLRRPQTSTPIQAKLTIGEPGDKYEQEADETARQVVQRIHQQSNQPVQREAVTEEEKLQTKPVDNIQRQESSEEEELQMKPMVQRVADGGMAASSDLETSIQQARGSGQPLADSIKSPMEQAFGADFSRVRVHTDSQADQLNQSIQAKAFTTGQDVFFRQGAYEPQSLGGQELLAHKLTHLVQQNRRAVQRTSEVSNCNIEKSDFVQAKLEVDKNTITDLDSFLGNYKLKLKRGNDIGGFSEIQGIQIEVNSSDFKVQAGIAKFIEVVDEVIQGKEVARIAFGANQKYGEIQQISNQYFTYMAGKEKQSKMYALGALGHEIYENFVAAKKAPNSSVSPQIIQDYWEAKKDSTSGYQDAHNTALEKESIISEAAGLGRRIGQYRYKKGGIALLENGVIKTQKSTNSEWINVNKHQYDIEFELMPNETIKSKAKAQHLQNIETKMNSHTYAYMSIDGPSTNSWTDANGKPIAQWIQDYFSQRYNDISQGKLAVGKNITNNVSDIDKVKVTVYIPDKTI